LTRPLRRFYHAAMAAPEFLICLNCETPCYTFEWEDGTLTEAACQVCGNDEPEQFIIEEDFEALSGD
jgi:hypothetical protein